MGYCYSKYGHLCCDLCGSPGAHKERCPFGYCPRTAVCDSCRKSRKELFTRAKHREYGCEASSVEFHGREEKERALLAQGEWVRRSAVNDNVDPEFVKVSFTNAYKEILTVYMTKELYRNLGVLEPTTLAVYETLAGGPLTRARDPVSKRVG